MTTLSWFYHCVNYCEQNGITVDANYSFPTVDIKRNGETLVFLQGEDAAEFVKDVEEAYDRIMIVDKGDCEFFFAYDFISNLDWDE